NIGAYTHPKWIHLAVSEAREVAEGEDYKSLTACYADMRRAAQAEFEKGCDLPTVTLKVDFVNCPDAEEYRQFSALSDIFLGDSVRVIARRIGIEVSMRMTQYTYDCLTKKYTSVTLGTAADTLEGTTIAARQLASGSISGMKLAIHSVGAGQLQNGAVGSLQIKNAAIGSAHIQDAAITRAHIAEALIDVLNVNALTAVSAKIQELAAGSVTTDELYTSIAMIATAQLTTANIVNASIQWADIEALAAEIALISKAQITTANITEANIDWAAITTLSAAVASMVRAHIGTADIDWAHIKDLATDTAIITQGVGGELYIAKLAVTEANLVSLTVGELVVKGADGHFYSVSVDENGGVVSTLKQVSGGDVADASIHAGEKLIEGSVTAATLNAQDIFADSAIIRSLIASNLDVDVLFAREATIAALNAADIRGNEYLRLMVSDKADKSDVDALGERLNAAELKITPDAIVSTVTGSTAYQQEREQIYSDMDALLGYRVEILADTVFLTENIPSTTLRARVWRGTEDVTDTLAASRFIWTRESSDSMADAIWNDSHKGLKAVLVSTADVLRQASFRCDLVDG
ncbi:MAG: phage tail spike protein, partial [Clostridia bacterium]|nr:phage tail spike protein [Clostridia bacterium]